MNSRMLLGHGRLLVPIPGSVWQEHTIREGQQAEDSLAFMSEDHHRVRDLVVVELPRVGAPLPPEFIAQRLGLALDKVRIILDDLERHLTFLFRNEQGAVHWAYPVTVDRTPHRITFSTGEQVYAA